MLVLERPEIPLHTNGSERDIRCHVIKRKISGGNHSDAGRDRRDAFLGLMHTATKLGIAFWDYLGARLRTSHSPVVLTPQTSSVAADNPFNLLARGFAPVTLWPGPLRPWLYLFGGCRAQTLVLVCARIFFLERIYK